MTIDASMREHVRRLLAWEDAHVGFDTAVPGVPLRTRGTVASGMPHSLWQLVEHIRITQRDILDFCRNPDYEEMTWPDDYWPRSAAPSPASAWKKSLSGVRADRAALRRLAGDRSIDLTARI